MNKPFCYLTACLVLSSLLAACGGPGPNDLLAAKDKAEGGGWTVVKTETAANDHIQVIRQKVSDDGGRYYLDVQICVFNSAADPISDCESVVLHTEVVQPEPQ